MKINLVYFETTSFEIFFSSWHSMIGLISVILDVINSDTWRKFSIFLNLWGSSWNWAGQQYQSILNCKCWRCSSKKKLNPTVKPIRLSMSRTVEHMMERSSPNYLLEESSLLIGSTSTLSTMLEVETILIQFHKMQISLNSCQRVSIIFSTG